MPKVSRYELTTMGKIGVALFILPPPIAAFYSLPPSANDGQKVYRQALRDIGGTPEIFMPSPTILILLATASLIGMVMLFLGREIVTTEY